MIKKTYFLHILNQHAYVCFQDFHQPFLESVFSHQTHPYKSFNESRTGAPDQEDNLDVQVAVPNVLEAT